MRTRSVYWAGVRSLAFIGIALVINKAWGGEPPPPPVVHILATDPCSAEQGADTATFTVFRTGPTNEPLTVRYDVAGAAANGVDYARLPGEVTIPASASSAPITITPVDDALVEGGETVAVFLHQPILWPPPYIVCWPSFAVGHIEDNDLPPTNRPPVVRLTNPPDESVFLAPLDLRLTAAASDFDGRVRSVEFFAGANSLGIVSNRPIIIRPIPLGDELLDLSIEGDPLVYPEIDPGANLDLTLIPASVFSLVWSNVPPGPHVLTAVATDNLGASSRSAPVHIRVIDPPPQPIVNVIATDPEAAEPDPTGSRLNTATFTVHRSGSTEIPLTVYYRLGGSAENGVDYGELPHSVVIERGARRAEVVIKPIDDDRVEGSESVAIKIVPPICIETFPPPPDCYVVGRESEARAVIHDNDITPGNLPPVVEIVRPLDGSVFLAPADLNIAAAARDHDGRVVSVEFFEGTNSLGVVSNAPSLLASNLPPFMLAWGNVPPGRYVLHALATDNDGAQARSRPVEIKVADREPPSVVNIIATDPEGAEVLPGAMPNPARFEVSRSGPAERPLVVFYSIGGSASNGVDYREISNRVVIPGGASRAPIVIEPIDDRLVEGPEGLVLTLEPPVCIAIFPPPGDCYVVGSNNAARAVIRDNDTSLSNQPPKIALVRPSSGDIFQAPADIVIVAEARDADGFVRLVEFFGGTNRLCVATNSLDLVANLPAGYEPVFRCEWSNVPPGSHELRARATDNRGAVSWSEPVRIRVIEDYSQPVVTIEATDPHGAEEDWTYYPLRPEEFIGPPVLLRPDVAVFTVTRDRGTNADLTVYFRLGGTASNGLDYLTIGSSVVIPRGSRHATIVVLPVDDALVEGTETVIASLDPVACIAIFPPPPDCYLVGEPARAVASIRDNDFENQPPKVEIVEPQNEEIFREGADIEIIAAVRDADGYVTEVEFFEGTNSIGSESRVYIVAPPPGELHKFSIIWSNVPPGRYALTAKATDDGGAMSRSDAVRIIVVEPCRVPEVTIRALDPYAREQSPLLAIPPDMATLRVTRSCDTNSALFVRYSIGGTASNGVDYTLLTGMVMIPAGSHTADILVDPIDDQLAEGVETVEIALEEGNCLAVGPLNICYTVGTPGKAVAFIRDDENRPPRVAVVSPENGDRFRAGADIPIVAQTLDADGWVPRVEFFVNGRSIGVREINFLVEPPPGQMQRFSLMWSNAPSGRHVLTAQATDHRGAMTMSAPVTIEVVDVAPIPVVCITAPDAFAREGDPPNTATFRIRRSGGTNAPLTVRYTIRGTASNGVDYVMIPGTATIPAGRRGIRIIVTPIDDRRDEPIESVILRLDDAALYNVGFPGRAGAIIVDNDPPRPGPCRLDDGNFHARLDSDARCYRLEISRDLIEWRPICTNLAGDDAIHFVDPDASDLPHQFYRVVPVSEEEFFDED